MIHDNIDPMLQHFFPEQDEPIDFAKIAKATNHAIVRRSPQNLVYEGCDFADFYRLLEASRLGLPLPASGADSSFSKSTTSTSLAKRYIETHVLESGAADTRLAAPTTIRSSRASQASRSPNGCKA